MKFKETLTNIILTGALILGWANKANGIPVNFPPNFDAWSKPKNSFNNFYDFDVGSKTKSGIDFDFFDYESEILNKIYGHNFLNPQSLVVNNVYFIK